MNQVLEFVDLFDDVFFNIFAFLSCNELCCLNQSCKRLYDVANLYIFHYNDDISERKLIHIKNHFDFVKSPAVFKLRGLKSKQTDYIEHQKLGIRLFKYPQISKSGLLFQLSTKFGYSQYFQIGNFKTLTALNLPIQNWKTVENGFLGTQYKWGNTVECFHIKMFESGQVCKVEKVLLEM